MEFTKETATVLLDRLAAVLKIDNSLEFHQDLHDFLVSARDAAPTEASLTASRDNARLIAELKKANVAHTTDEAKAFIKSAIENNEKVIKGGTLGSDTKPTV